MSLQPTVWLTSLLLVNFVVGQKSLVNNRDEFLDNGNNDGRMLVGLKDAERDENQCDEGEYWSDWNSNGSCQTCLLHDDLCKTSIQCCSVDNMACYRVANRDPICLCHPNFAWDNIIGQCYLVPVPPILLITAYIALGMACIVAVSAICVHSISCCKRQWRKFRGHDEVQDRRQFRQGHRQNARVVPRPRPPRRLSSLIPLEPVAPLPSKPPAYEEVFGVSTVSQTLPHAPTGSMRSLPPAYSLSEDPESPEPDVESPEPDVECPEPEIELVTSQSVILETEENTQPSLGVDNPAHHI